MYVGRVPFMLDQNATTLIGTDYSARWHASHYFQILALSPRGLPHCCHHNYHHCLLPVVAKTMCLCYVIYTFNLCFRSLCNTYVSKPFYNFNDLLIYTFNLCMLSIIPMLSFKSRVSSPRTIAYAHFNTYRRPGVRQRSTTTNNKHNDNTTTSTNHNNTKKQQIMIILIIQLIIHQPHINIIIILIIIIVTITIIATIITMTIIT